MSSTQNHNSLAPDAPNQDRMSVLGPKTRFVTRAPWEPGGEEDLEEEGEGTQEAETRSLFGGRGRVKKPKDFAKESKGRAFPASFAPRASSSSRPSVDVSTPTSTSSGAAAAQAAAGRPLPLRRNSAATTYSNGSDAIPFPANRADRSGDGPKPGAYRGSADNNDAPTHPYATTPATSTFEERARAYEYMPPSPSIYPESVRSMPIRDIPDVPKVPKLPTQNNDIPVKMAPWQYTPSSPTFQLVSLEEAQALKARQRQMSLGNPETSSRPRVQSGPNRKSLLPMEHPSPSSTEEGPTSGAKTLKGRRSLMGLFARGKEKDRRSESPPPVPTLPIRSGSTPGTPVHPLSAATSPAISTPSTAVPSPHPDQTPHIRAPKRIPPPALNVVVTSPQPQQAQMHDLRPPPPISIPQKSATPPPSSSARQPVPRKQASTSTLSPTTGLKPNSAPSTIQGFKGLSLRPMSTMFSSMPADYLSNTVPVPTAGSMSPSTSAQFSTQSPTTPSLWSSRSESISTGSSELPLHTPGLMQSLSSGSFTDGSGPSSPSMLQKQFNGAKEVYKHHIAELEAQVAALKAEVAELKQCPCPSCGFLGGGSSSGEKTSVVHRPRAKTAAGNHRTLFGNTD
ncbi:hypothetical protein CPB86DRAFT_791604 [Serendipita vermifera]|nr:hypothetical protein CPB86DRAFT_791604 [Serendipita vermifera]